MGNRPPRTGRGAEIQRTEVCFGPETWEPRRKGAHEGRRGREKAAGAGEAVWGQVRGQSHTRRIGESAQRRREAPPNPGTRMAECECRLSRRRGGHAHGHAHGHTRRCVRSPSPGRAARGSVNSAVLPPFCSSVCSGEVLGKRGLRRRGPSGKGQAPPSVRLENRRLDFLPQTHLSGPALTPVAFNFSLCGFNFLIIFGKFREQVKNKKT